jgi:mono/diheme cytochrome c family protein
MDHKAHAPAAPAERKRPLYGVIAEYKDVDTLMSAARKVRDAGYTRWDTHTPFPVHGIEGAMGFGFTKLPWIVLCCGLTGLTCAVLLQWWTNGVDYPFLTSGKPLFALPPAIPICFELTVLFSAFGAFFGMLALNKLPQLHHPLFEHEAFKRVTDDRFFLAIEAEDPKFGLESTKSLLAGTGGCAEVSTVHGNGDTGALPAWMKNFAIVLPILLLVPLANIVTARHSTSPKTRLQLIPDMDQQTKFRNQTQNVFFADQRNERPRVEGTIPRGLLREDQHFYGGKTGPGENDWATQFPAALRVDEALIARGRERFNITCAACHGQTGVGDGLVSQRATGKYPSWIPPLSLHTENLLPQPVGQTFNTIRNGIRTMPAYSQQITIEDTWAIVAYVKALQKSHAFPVAELSPEERQKVQ